MRPGRQAVGDLARAVRRFGPWRVVGVAIVLVALIVLALVPWYGTRRRRAAPRSADLAALTSAENPRLRQGLLAGLPYSDATDARIEREETRLGALENF